MFSKVMVALATVEFGSMVAEQLNAVLDGVSAHEQNCNAMKLVSEWLRQNYSELEDLFSDDGVEEMLELLDQLEEL